MKDIAQLAGVSHGTVSNVINHKGNVNSEKIRLVEEAARQLGYHANTQARNLRKETSRQCALILPDIEQRIYSVFYTTLKNLLEEDRYETSLYLSFNSPETERHCIRTAISGRPEFIVTVNSAAYAEYPGESSDFDSKIIFVNNPLVEPQGNQVSFFFDFREAGAAFAEQIPLKSRAVAFFFDSANPQAHQFLFEALKTEFGRRDISLVPFFYNSRQVYHGVLAILKHTPPFDAIITNNPIYRERLRQIGELSGSEIPLVFSFSSRETLTKPGEPVYQFDYRELAVKAFAAVKEPRNYFGKSFSLKPSGFVQDKSSAHIAKARDLSLLTVTSPASDILSTLAPYLKRTRGINLKVIALPYEELFSLLSSGNASYFDLIRIDMAWGSRLEKNLYLPLDTLLGRFRSLTDAFLPEIRSVYCPEDREHYSIPFDPSIQMLFYRQDLFENATIRRQYYEKTRKQLAVPVTFNEYNQIAAFFTAAFNPNSHVPFGATMTFGSTTVAACDILPRVRELGGEFFNGAGRLCLTSEPFQRALESYLAMRSFAGPEIHYWWQDSLDAFIQGRAAMTIVFINHASRIIKVDNASAHIKVGAAPVPGNFPLLGGGCIGINKKSQNIDPCIDFLNWVYSDEIANMMTILGGLSPCETVFTNEEILEVYPWLRNVGKHFSQGWRRFGSPLNPHFDNYQFERIFGDAVRNAVMGIMRPEEALKIAQEQCDREFL